LTNNAVDDFMPSAASDGTNVAVFYRRGNAVDWYSNVRLMLLNANGSVASDVAVTNFTDLTVLEGPYAIWSGTEYAAVWTEQGSSGNNLVFQRFSAAGSAIGQAIPIANSFNSFYSPRLVWSPTYHGYVALYATSGTLTLRRLGADASSPETPNTLALNSNDPTGFAVAPDGSFAAVSAYWGVSLTPFNADGSRTAAAVSLSQSGNYPSLIHDGTSWLSVWAGGVNGYGLTVNRGAIANSPFALSSPPPYVAQPLAVSVRNSIAIAWAESSTQSAPYKIRMQRFAAPSSASSALTPIHDAVDVLPTANLKELRNFSLAVSGASSLMAVWADDRWGTKREIFAAPINVGTCP
jgi:hypothetical protein